MLFFHGADDRVEDVEQSRMMVDGLQGLDKPVEYVEFENGDHYLSIYSKK